MNGIEVANKIKDVLESVEGWTGKIYVYIPDVKSDQEYLDALVDNSTGRVDAWFIRRSGFRSIKYGEGVRIPTNYRVKQHTFSIRGWQSIYDRHSGKSLEDATSEIDFQDRCDKIEETLAKTYSLGVSTHDVVVAGVNFTINHDMFSKVLCHYVNISLTVEERLCTNYEL